MSALKERILARVKDDLSEIENALRENLTPHLDLVSEVAGHILFSGGKRLRPLLFILCARVCGYAGAYAGTFSIIFEYLHAATLLHDDLIDGATLRRGSPAAHRLWGNEVAVLTGDFLLARALSLAAETDNPKIIRAVAHITESMSQGEIDQLQNRGNIDLSESEYMEIIRCKTAVLFQCACRVGGLISGVPRKAKTNLNNFGFHLGIAFQMVDDLLDYTTDTRTLGKNIGADLREGRVTLPVIHALKTAPWEDRMRMEAIIKNKDFSKKTFDLLVERLNEYEGIDYTLSCAQHHVVLAKKALLNFPPSRDRETLLAIAEYALIRKNWCGFHGFYFGIEANPRDMAGGL